MAKDGGCSFKCADSSAWRQDWQCGNSSDFMATGERHGQIPTVPKGFVRFVKLQMINNPVKRKRSWRQRKETSGADRFVTYLYCGDASTVADTTGWTPHCEAFAAARQRARGTSRSLQRGRRGNPCHVNSVEGCLERYPLLKEAGVTLNDFSFSRWKPDNFSGSKLEPPDLSAQPTESAGTFAGPPMQPGTPRHEQQQVDTEVAPVERQGTVRRSPYFTTAPSAVVKSAAAVSPSALKRRRLVYSISSDDDDDEPLAVRQQRMQAAHRQMP